MADILVVEDEGVIGMNVEIFLNSQGHSVMEVVDEGAKALTIIEACRPDVILMDIVLKGGMSGIETARMVGERYGIPVIYMTAHNDSATIEKVRTTRHAGILIKPFEFKELKQAIDKALSEAQ